MSRVLRATTVLGLTVKCSCSAMDLSCGTGTQAARGTGTGRGAGAGFLGQSFADCLPGPGPGPPAVAKDSGGLTASERTLSSRIVQSHSMDRVNRAHPSDISPTRHVVVVLGITGSGKSSTANTLRASRYHKFAVSDSITSVTRSVAYKDFNPVGNGPLSRVDFRVVDTPGLMDTNRAEGEVEAEYAALRALAPHGVSAFLVCVPMGRVTDEHERAVRELARIFGPEALAKHSTVVVTGATAAGSRQQLLFRDQIVSQLESLPLHHYLRQFVQECSWRVVGVENNTEPARSVSTLRLLQSVMDVLEANGGSRYEWRQGTVAGGSGSGDDSGGDKGRAEGVGGGASQRGMQGQGQVRGQLAPGLQCTHSIATDEGGRRVLTIVCQLPRETGGNGDGDGTD